MSEKKSKPVPDEQTLAKLLEAAYVLQEHNREMQSGDFRQGVKRGSVKEKNQYWPQNSSSQAKSPRPVPLTSSTSILGKIVETQHQIQLRRMEFVSALKLVADQVSEMTHASGAAIGIVEGKTIRYRAVAGHSSPVPECFLPLNKSMAAPCLATGKVFRSSQTWADSMMDAEECKRRGIHSLIAVPVFHNGGIAGGLEIYYDSPDAFTEEDVHTCQLMAGLVTEALVREEDASWKKLVANERAAMLEALEKLQPNLAALVERPDANSGELELIENNENPVPMEHEMTWVEDAQLAQEPDPAGDESQQNPQALARGQTTLPADWSTAASARAFLEQLASGKRTGALLRFWNVHRGDIYLGFAVILVACVLRWGIWGDHSAKAPPTPARAPGTQGRSAPDAGLSVFDRILVQLGLAEAPAPPPDRGNPAVQVWVDLQTALYYCPGTDQYGKTAKGKFTTQHAAQLDQFEPAYRKACN